MGWERPISREEVVQQVEEAQYAGAYEASQFRAMEQGFQQGPQAMYGPPGGAVMGGGGYGMGMPMPPPMPVGYGGRPAPMPMWGGGGGQQQQQQQQQMMMGRQNSFGR